jgi:hypothetical protein
MIKGDFARFDWRLRLSCATAAAELGQKKTGSISQKVAERPGEFRMSTT